MNEMSTINMKAVDMAAQSPDPRVRSVALRRLQINNELEQLDSFLSFYGMENMSVASVAMNKTVQQPLVNGASKPRSGQSKAERMIEAACQIVLSNGRPMPLSVLFDRMHAAHPDLCPANATSMRVRLSEHKDKIRRIDARGYWPVAVGEPPDDA